MIWVFYAGRLYEELQGFKELKHLRITCSPEIYNGAYFYLHEDTGMKWYHMDGTPVLLADVPKELRLLVLLLT